MTPLAIIISARGAADNAAWLLQSVACKSLIGRALETARLCLPEGPICVSSGDEAVLEWARRERVLALPAATGRDDAATLGRPSASQVEGTLGQIQAALLASGGNTLGVPLYPLLGCEDLQAVARAAVPEGCPAALAAVEPAGALWWRACGNDAATPLDPLESMGADAAALRRSGRYLIETGALYAFETDAFRRGVAVFSSAVPCILERSCALRVTMPADVDAATAILSQRQTSLDRAALPNPIGAIIFDFDGVFTDNRVIVFEDGREAAVCDRADGWGLGQLKKMLPVPILVLSTERNPIVRARCQKLGLECINGVPDKLVVLKQWLQGRSIDPTSVIYVGNDVNDLSCMRAVGCPVAVADAYPQVKALARIILSAPGGKGAVRELTELVICAPAGPARSDSGVSPVAATVSWNDGHGVTVRSGGAEDHDSNH